MNDKERITVANFARGSDIMKLISFGLVDKQTESKPLSGEGATFTESMARRIKSETGSVDALLKLLRDTSKKFQIRSLERLKEPAEALGNWAIGLAALPDNAIEVNNDQFEFKMKEGLALKESSQNYVYLLSNTKDDYLWYQTGKAKKAAKEKRLIYQDPTKFGAQLMEAIGTSDSITLAVSPKIAAFDNTGRIAKAVEFFAKTAMFFDENDMRQAGEMYRNLVGELPEEEKRRIFKFDPGMVLDVIQGRIWGRAALAIRDWRSELVKARESGADELRQVMALADAKIARLPDITTQTAEKDVTEASDKA